MEKDTWPGEDPAVWPPAPTQEPPRSAVTPLTQLSETWVWGQVLGRMLLLGMAFGAICGAGFGAWFGDYLMPSIDLLSGLTVGLIFGAIAGLLLGFLEGMVLASVTCAVFLPLESAAGYRRAIGILALVLTLGGASLLMGGLFGDWRNNGITSPLGLNWFTVVPVALAMGAAWVASQLIARWYATASSKS